MQRLRGWLLCAALALLALQFYFVGMVLAMRWIDPPSTSFERSQAWQLARPNGDLRWSQQWVGYGQISVHLKRAVIASEDDGFVDHDGVDWGAIEKAWSKNTRAEERAERARAQTGDASRADKRPKPVRSPKVVGGSTITQQLAKNLFLSGERTLARKAQEFVITLALEALLSKERILEIYLNHVEWGQGVFGAEAAAQRYYGKHASQLGALEAARLAVMLPRPKYFEKLPQSAYVASRAEVIVARMPGAQLP
ncbi:MAG: transglycosylase domain-containing protein [Rhodoferax sp.]